GVADTRKRTLKNKLVFRSENLCGPNQVSGFHTQIVRVPRVAGPDLGLLVPSAETKPINFGSEESLQFGLAERVGTGAGWRHLHSLQAGRVLLLGPESNLMVVGCFADGVY